MIASESAFSVLAEQHRRELHVHCYRLLGSFEEAEDVVQETFLRAWRGRSGATRGGALRAWLYKIATNACLDALRRRKRGGADRRSPAEVPWLQPYPDRLLDEVAPREEEPDAVVFARETIELAFIAVIQALPPRQRAVLILRDVLEWSAAETAELLEISVAAANSALQRARATLSGNELAKPRSAADLSADERRLLQGFIDTHESGDVEAAAAMIRDDVRVTMPPNPWLYEGRAAVMELMRGATGPEAPGEWLLVPTRANRMPAAASYLRAPGDTLFRAFKLDVLRVQDGLIAEITTFAARLFGEFGLPQTRAGR
jgi:RNA polymerase sigma-70 factor (TIGR02960 family)